MRLACILAGEVEQPVVPQRTKELRTHEVLKTMISTFLLFCFVFTLKNVKKSMRAFSGELT